MAEHAEEAREWLRKADQDLLSAQILRDRDGPATVGCYLCQQAIEKALKALLVFFGEVPPRTHDLVELARHLRGRASPLGVSMEDLAAYTDYAVASRYPGFGDPKADEDLPALCAKAECVVLRAATVMGTGPAA